MKEKIYPTLPDIRENPTAPNIVNGGSDDRGHSYRLKVITDVQKAVALGFSGVATGAISLIGNIFSKKATTKAEKHLKIKTLASAKLDTIASYISKAMMDDYISDEEFKLIMSEMDKYKAMKEEIRSNTKKKLKTEEEESLIERGRQEARESFRRLVEKNKTI